MSTRVTSVLTLSLLTGFVAGSPSESRADEWDAALKNAEAAHEALSRCHRLVDAWYQHAGKDNALLPQNLNSRVWTPENSAADLWSFFVLTSHLIGSDESASRIQRTFRDEVRLTTRIGTLPDHYDIDRGAFVYAEPELGRVLFGASEYDKDGILPIVELTGRGAFFERGRGMLVDIFERAAVKTQFGLIPADSAEVNGELLQSLCRYYAATGDPRFKRWAEQIGDAYFLEMLPKNNDLPCHSWDFVAGKPRRDLLSLNDHGNEIIVGLAELVMLEHVYDQEKAGVYVPAMRRMLDKLLAIAVNEDGLWYQQIQPGSGKILDRRTPDTWGYALDAVYTFYLITGEEKYRDAVARALRGIDANEKYLDWGGADAFADSIEGCLVLLNRIREPAAEAWLERIVPVFLAKQRADGIVEGWHGDGNYARTALMYALMKTGGTHLSGWRPDVKFGAAVEGETIRVQLSASEPWSGRLHFDHPRHRRHFGLSVNYPRLNEFPEWYTVEPARLYQVEIAGREPMSVLGADLIDGLPLETSGDTLRIVVRPTPGPPYGPNAPRPAPEVLADRLLLQVEDFIGPWRRQTNIGGFIGSGFCTSNANPNIADTTMRRTLAVKKGGTYAIWVRAYTSPNGKRAVQAQVGEVLMNKTHTQNETGWTWQRAGEVELGEGEIEIAIRDADVGYETADAVLLTDQLDYDPAAQERRWSVFPKPLPPPADALRFNIDACCALLDKRKDPASRSEWEAALPELRSKLARALGLDPMPQKTPLNARVTGKSQREWYTIENVVFESRPKFYVTANLYIPKDVELPAPAVVIVPGHAMREGKNYPEYQMAELGHVRQGFVVLSYDPIGQGERRQPGYGHHLGYGSLLVGQTNEGMIVWDTIRALDYLVSRPEVDASRVGLAGNSGGGENTFYTMPFEPRFKAAGSFGFVCSYEQWLRYGGGHCICNHLPGIVREMEEFEIIGLNVPRPFLFGNGSKDRIFPIAGTRRTRERIEKLYALFDIAERVRLVEAPLPHAWAEPLREACYGWMNRWLAGRGDGSPVDESGIAAEPFDSPDLQCFKDGKFPDDALSIVDLNRERAETLVRRYLTPPETSEEWKRRAQEWRKEVWRIFGGRPAETQPTAKSIDAFEWRGHKVETLALATEPGVEVAALFMRPMTDKPTPVVLYLDERNKLEARDDPAVAKLLAEGVAVFALDPRGLGETLVNDNQLTSDSVVLGRHIFAQRVWDVVQAARYLATRPDVDATRIHCYGRGAGALLALFAAALERPFESVVADSPLASYRYYFEDNQPQPIWLAVPNLLRVIDVPQVAALACPTRVQILSPIGFGRQPLGTGDARETFSFARATYQRMQAAENFVVTAADPERRLIWTRAQ